MHTRLKTIIKKYHLIEYAYSISFNVSRIIGFIRFPSYDYTFRRLINHARAGYWNPKFGRMGKCVQIDSGVVIRGNPKNIEIDDYSYIDTNAQLEVYAPIEIGKYVHLAANMHIQSGDKVIIKDFACIANGTKIYASSNTYKTPCRQEKNVLLSMSSSAPSKLQCIKHGSVIIDEYAFVGMNCVILPGVRIGRGAIIGAGSVVTKDIPPYTIAFGIPAMPAKKRFIPEC